MLTRRLRRAVVVALALCTPAAAPHAQTVDYTWTGTELLHWYRYNRDGNGSNWLAGPKAYPGTTLPYADGTLVQSFEFVNPFDFATGFMVSNVVNYDAGNAAAGDGIGGVHLLAFLGAWNPFEPAEGYLGDSGFSCHGVCGVDADFSVLAPANATIQVLAFRMYGSDEPGSRFTFDAAFIESPTVVPEPSTWLLMATGLAAIGGITRHRSRRA